LPGAGMMHNFQKGIIKEYTAIIEIDDINAGSFVVNENIVITDGSYSNETLTTLSLGNRTVYSADRGLLLREVSFIPLEASESGFVNLSLPDGTEINGILCDTYFDLDSKGMHIIRECPEAKVEIRDMPINMMYAIKDADEINARKYIETETIIWSNADLGKGVIFAYVKPPYQHLRPFLSPFLNASSFSQWSVLLAGFIITFLLSSVLKPLIVDAIQNKIKPLLNQRAKKKEVTKTTLIISSRGEEKEIEIKDDDK
jgi:hypothetical protein